MERAGRIDISVNLVPRGDFQGVPLIRTSVEDYVRPVAQGIACQFVTARAAARRMTAQGSGVILSLDSGSANGSPMTGGTGAADGAIDALIRQLDGLRMPRRSPRIADIAAPATFLASDAGVAITGTWVNATAGMFSG